MSSLDHCCAKTTATSAFFAAAAALAGLAPESKVTLAPGTFATTAFKGEVGNHTCSFHLGEERPGGSTCADPPPEIMAVSAFVPMMAILRARRSSGSTPV